MEPRRSVLVVCTHNSCRSQMAEAFLRQIGGTQIEVASAGLRPADDIHELARTVMAEVGLSLDGQHPASIRDYLGKASITTVITVCQRAEEHCPTSWPGAVEWLNWPFEDPASYQPNDPPAQLAKFREIRDAIREQVQSWVAQLNPS